MSVSLVRSTTAAHPIILNGATTCNVTLNASEECTYALTDTIDGNKFNVNAAAVGDGSFTVTLSLKVAANKDTQIAYTVTLTATPVSGTNNPKSENITIYVSSSTTDVAGAVLSNVPSLTSSVNINEFDTTTKALWSVAQTNAVDQSDITVIWDGAAPTGYTLNSALVNGNIEINRSTNVDMADLTTDNGSYGTDTVNVILRYVDTAHNNNGVGSNKTYTSDTQSLIIPYTPVQIDFYESAALNTERESGNVVAAAGAVVDYYNGTVTGSDGNCTVADQQAQENATKIIPVYVNQKCTWTVTGGPDSAKFTIFSDVDGEIAIGATKTATAYVKFDPGAKIDFADQNEYNGVITITDGGFNGGTDATKSRTLAIKVAVAADTTNPVILQSDAAAAGSFVDLAANAITKNIDEQAGAYNIMTFNLDVTKHGVNDPYANARYYLLADPTAPASGTAVSMQVTSKSGSNTMTFEITDSENNSNREAVLKVSAAGVSFDNNYSNTNDNVYEIGIFAVDSATGPTNKSAVIKATITVKNTDALKYHGSASSTASIVSSGVVQSGGTTNASTVQFSLMSSMPIAAVAGDAASKYNITLYDVTNASAVNTLISSVTYANDISHSDNTNIQVSRWVFDVSGMTTGTQYKLSLPALNPATSHQNVASSLAGSVITETTNNDFIFTFDVNSAVILFNCAESIEWPRGQPYTEFHIESNVTVNTGNIDNIGAKHNGTAGNRMSCFNGVDPRAAAGTICFFTWTLTDANNNITSKTRTVTIREATHFGKDWRAPPNMRATFTHDLTFGGTDTAEQPAAMTYTQLKEDGATTTRSDGTDLAVDRDTTFTTTQLGTLWTYSGVNVTNATLNEYYSVNNEDVYAFNFGANSTHTQKTKDFGTAAGCTPIDAADKTGFVSLTGIGDAVADWDLATGYLSTDLRGLRVITLRENTTGHNITVELANVNIEKAIQTAFTLFSATQDPLDTTLNIYDNAAPLTFKMNKADFNNIFFYKLDNDAYLTDASGSAVGTVWNNLPTSNTLRSEDMCLHHETANWPQLLAGSQDGATVLNGGTSYELHELTPTGYKGVGNFQAGIPASGDAINDIVVENWSYDILGVKEMQYIFSTTSTIKTEINNFLTSPGAGSHDITSLEGAIRNKLALLASGTKTNYTDSDATIKGRTGQFLLHQFRDKLAALGDSTARYRLTNRLGGIFHENNRNTQGGAVNDYYPFIWQAGDKLVFGVNFTHSDVNLGTLTDSTYDKTLSNLPFKFTVELV